MPPPFAELPSKIGEQPMRKIQIVQSAIQGAVERHQRFPNVRQPLVKPMISDQSIDEAPFSILSNTFDENDR